jgi:hypothetical protein
MAYVCLLRICSLQEVNWGKGYLYVYWKGKTLKCKGQSITTLKCLSQLSLKYILTALQLNSTTLQLKQKYSIMTYVAHTKTQAKT